MASSGVVFVRNSSVLSLGLIAAVALGLAACETSSALQDPINGPLNNRPLPKPQIQRSPDSLLSSIRDPNAREVTETVARGSGEFVSKADFATPATTALGQDGITLNLLNVPIAQAAKTILGDVMKVNYTVSDKVTGTITLQTTTPAPKEALIDAFEVALKANGAVIARNDGFYRIVPLANAGGSLSPGSSGRGQGGPGTRIQIVPLRYVSASEIKRIADPVLPQGSILRVDDTRNLLVISGTSRELADAINLIALFDVDWMRGMSFALYPVKTSDPEAIVKELDTVFGLDKDGPLKGVVRFVPNRRLGAVLVISSKAAHLDTAKSFIDKFDRLAQQGEAQLYVYKIQNRPALELANLLQKVLSTDDAQQPKSDAGAVAPRYDPVSVSSSPGADLRGATSSSLGSSASSLSGQTGSTRSSSLSGSLSQSPSGDRSSLAASSSFQAGGTKVVADEANNSLLVQAVPKDYERILRILQRLDSLPTQVMLEAVIAEVTLNDELKFGVKWFLQKKNSTFSFTDAATGAVTSTFPGFSYMLSMANVQVALDAVSGVTKVNVISSPSLMVMDNRKATLQVGDQVPITTQTAQSVAVVGSPIVNSVTLKDTGVILSVTPRVNDSGRVVLEIEQEVSSVTKTTSSGIDSPTIQQRRINTTVVVADGEVVALGGLIQERDNATRTQVPFLGNLPIVGAAFRTKDDIITRTELIIFIRPQVVRDAQEARQVTEEFKARINLEKPVSQRGRDVYRRDFDRVIR